MTNGSRSWTISSANRDGLPVTRLLRGTRFALGLLRRARSVEYELRTLEAAPTGTGDATTIQLREERKARRARDLWIVVLVLGWAATAIWGMSR